MEPLKFYIDIVKKTQCPRLKQLFDFRDIDLSEDCGPSEDKFCDECELVQSLPTKKHSKILNYFYCKQLWK